MYRELVKNLTKEQIDALELRGVARSTVSNWKHGKRLPTRPQAIHLAQVTGVEVMDLERELMVLESAPDQREQFLKLLKVPASAIAGVILVLGMFGAPEKANADNGLQLSKQAAINIHRGKYIATWQAGSRCWRHQVKPITTLEVRLRTPHQNRASGVSVSALSSQRLQCEQLDWWRCWISMLVGSQPMH